jgi:hypothetical protein
MVNSWKGKAPYTRDVQAPTAQYQSDKHLPDVVCAIIHNFTQGMRLPSLSAAA